MMKVNRSWMVAVVVLVLVLIGIWRPWGGSEGEGRRILYYQDSMHPWVKLDHPGKCTICVMDLTPIYEGDQAFAAEDGVIVLSSNSITVLNVKTAEARLGTLGATMRVAGTIEANQTLTTVLAAPAPGRIDDMTVEYSGVEVEQGQVLVTLYSPELALEKRRYLVRSRMANHVDPFQNSQVSSSMDLSRVDVEVDPYFHDLLSPQSGTVLERNVYEGQYVGEGDTLMTIADSSLLWFRFDVYENQLAWFVPGQSISVTVPAIPGKVFPATVTFIEPTMDSVTRTVKVRAEIQNPRVKVAGGATMRLLRYGMYGDGQVKAEIPEVLTVPRSAILLPGSTAYAYVDKGEGAYERRRVKLGRQGDSEWEVLSGLMEGERVVTAGNVLIDAQAQIMHPLEAEDEEGDSEGGVWDAISGRLEVVQGSDVRLNSLQEAALAAFLEAADGVSSALSSDDFGRFKSEWERLDHELGELGQVFGPGTQLQEVVQPVVQGYRSEVGSDLESAREAFLPLSTALVELVQRVRVLPGEFRSVKVYHCPMAPEPGLWFQAEGPLANPFYGSEMLRCGNEVAPPAGGMTSAPLPAESIEELEEGVASMPMPMGHDHQAVNAPAPARDHSVMDHAAMNMKATVKSVPTLESIKGASMRNRMMAEAKDAAAGVAPAAEDSAGSEAESLPDLPQDAGRNIRSGRHTVSKAFWQRAAEIYSSTRKENITDHQVQPASVGTSAQVAGKPAVAVQGRKIRGQRSPVVASGEELRLLKSFVELAAGMSKALAEDDLAGFNRVHAEVASGLPGLLSALGTDHQLYELFRRMSVHANIVESVDLEIARRRFLLMSTQLVEVVKRLRAANPVLEGWKIYHCPMTQAPGLWVQVEGPLLNPYHGASMLECGSEVLP